MALVFNKENPLVPCGVCGHPTSSHSRYCSLCQADIGFPNVRLASAKNECEALDNRINDARVSTRTRKCEGVLDDFGNEVLKSKAVFCRNLHTLQDLIQNDNNLYVNFYQSVSSGARVPEINSYDLARCAVDSTLFPLFHDKITFAALSLDGAGPPEFGAYTVTLKEEIISNRATVFEENSIFFCQKYKIIAGNPIPPGYRTLWAKRHRLAMAKLHNKLEHDTKKELYPKILMEKPEESETDFIEVHIFGPIHRKSIERVRGPRPNHGKDLVIWSSIETKLKEVNAILEAE